MFRSIKFSYLATLAMIGLCACSSNKHKAEDAASITADPMAEMSSPADKVGSNPEDMLANEMNAGDSKASTPVTEDKAADPTADSFAELTKDAATTDATTVPATQPELSSSGGGATDTYTVKSGDTLMKVAFTLYGDIDRWKDIKEWNKDKLKTNHLKRGMKLQVEAGSFQVEQRDHSYMIKKGDTLANIALDVYGKKKKYKKLQQYNQKLIKNPNVIFAGFTLFYDITPQEVADAEAFHKNQPVAMDTSAPAPASTDTAAAAPAPSPAPWPPPSSVNPPPTTGNSAPIANNMAAPAAPAAPAKK